MTDQLSQLDSDRAAQFFQDMNAEGEPEAEFHPGIASRIPSKTAAGGALIQDEQSHFLFVTPIYKPYLEIPGGVVNGDESPLMACRREVREELGIDVQLGPLLVVDWVPQHGIWRDSLQFIFDGGTLVQEQVGSISVPHDELHGFQFASITDVAKKLKPSLLRRVELAMQAKADGMPRYAEFGRIA